MTTTSEISPRRRRRAWLIFVGIILVGLLGAVSSIVVVTNRIEAKRHRAMAEAAADTPNWRWPALEKARTTIPGAENSSWIVRRVYNELPKNWLLRRPVRGLPVPTNPDGPLRGLPLYKRLVDHEPVNEPFDAETVSGLFLELSPLAPALEQTKPLTGPMMDGRNPLVYRKVTFNILLPDTQNARIVARLLQMDALLKAQDGDPDGALAGCRAIFNVGRSIGEEPFAISQLVRIAIGDTVPTTLQSILALGEPSDGPLADLDPFLVDELKTPRLLCGVRGERAMLFELAEHLRKGEITHGSLVGDKVEKPESPCISTPMAPYYAYNQALLLGFMNRAVEISKQPTYRQPLLWKNWHDSIPAQNSSWEWKSGAFAYMFLPGLNALAVAEAAYEVRLQCARVMIASERYRIAHGQWPAQVNLLVPEFLDAPPVDPFNGQLLRMITAKDGLVIYSVGPDLVDNRGILDPKFLSKSPGHDFGYRLWNLDARHKPASQMQPKLPEDVFQPDVPKTP